MSWHRRNTHLYKEQKTDTTAIAPVHAEAAPKSEEVKTNSKTAVEAAPVGKKSVAAPKTENKIESNPGS